MQKKMLEKITNKIFINLSLVAVKESFSVFEVRYQCDDIKEFSSNLSRENYDSIKSSLTDFDYKWDLYIESFDYSISQDKFKEIDLSTNDDNSDIEVIFKIHKSSEVIVIFDDEIFEKFLKSISLESLLSILNNKKLPISFLCHPIPMDNQVSFLHRLKKI